MALFAVNVEASRAASSAPPSTSRGTSWASARAGGRTGRTGEAQDAALATSLERAIVHDAPGEDVGLRFANSPGSSPSRLRHVPEEVRDGVWRIQHVLLDALVKPSVLGVVVVGRAGRVGGSGRDRGDRRTLSRAQDTSPRDGRRRTRAIDATAACRSRFDLLGGDRDDHRACGRRARACNSVVLRKLTSARRHACASSAPEEIWSVEMQGPFKHAMKTRKSKPRLRVPSKNARSGDTGQRIFGEPAARNLPRSPPIASRRGC